MVRITLWIITVILSFRAAGSQLPITIRQNGYHGVTVAIGSKIPESNVLLQKVKVSTTNPVYYKYIIRSI